MLFPTMFAHIAILSRVSWSMKFWRSSCNLHPNCSCFHRILDPKENKETEISRFFGPTRTYENVILPSRGRKFKQKNIIKNNDIAISSYTFTFLHQVSIFHPKKLFRVYNSCELIIMGNSHFPYLEVPIARLPLRLMACQVC